MGMTELTDGKEELSLSQYNMESTTGRTHQRLHTKAAIYNDCSRSAQGLFVDKTAISDPDIA